MTGEPVFQVRKRFDPKTMSVIEDLVLVSGSHPTVDDDAPSTPPESSSAASNDEVEAIPSTPVPSPKTAKKVRLRRKKKSDS